MVTGISEQDILLKEQELQFAIDQYYTYDMSGLKQEITRTLDNETQLINQECHDKQNEIQAKFRQVKKLGADHIIKGNTFIAGDQPDKMDEQLIQMYEQHSEQFEITVRNAN